jgi:hypothetical protein
MGMFDELRCEADLPSGHPATARDFQTKSLLKCLDNYTITKEGRLILHSCHYESVGETENGFPQMNRIDTGDVDTEYHGDIRFYTTIGETSVDYVARFTHGTLEWIRPWSELSELHQQLITAY